MIRHRWLLTGLLITLCAAVGVAAWWADGEEPSTQPLFRVFHGKVVDQDGNPMQGVEIVVQLSPMVENYLYPGTLVPARRPEDKFSAYSGKNGGFILILREPRQVVEILDVKLAGYSWLRDWAWSNGPPECPLNGETRYFDFGAPRRTALPYTSDTDNPAIYVMVKNGHAGPITAMPSRGGSDWTGRDDRIVNRPQPVAIPSTGPSAPQGSDAINAAIREYIEKRNAPATRNAR